MLVTEAWGSGRAIAVAAKRRAEMAFVKNMMLFKVELSIRQVECRKLKCMQRTVENGTGRKHSGSGTKTYTHKNGFYDPQGINFEIYMEHSQPSNLQKA
jgi:hypothetical protein